MPIDPRDVALNPEEQEIEDHAEDYVPVGEGEARRIVEDFRLAARSGRSRVVSLRFDEATLARVKAAAATEGLPYQTFIQSVVFRYITGRLVDERDVRIVTKALSGA